MAITTDSLLDRIKLKGKIQCWRTAAIILATALLFFLISKNTDFIVGRDYVARVTVSGIVSNDIDQIDAIENLAKNNNVKAVIIYIDTPGGTAVGGETIYNAVKTLAEKKPVVSVMGSLATSAGYLIATAGERIFAHKGTITGSIGVILQSPNVTELAKKIGITMDTVKTGELKGTPSPFESLTPEGQKVMQSVVDSFHDVFIDIVAMEREMDKSEAIAISDGRVFTGLQALEKKLIDEIGGEKEAVKWLSKNKGIKESLAIKDVKTNNLKSGWKDLFGITSWQKGLLPESLYMHGLLSIWENSVIN